MGPCVGVDNVKGNLGGRSDLVRAPGLSKLVKCGGLLSRTPRRVLSRLVD